MTLTEGAVVFVIIWWLVLFMVLPWGVTRVEEEDMTPGEDPGAPAKARILLKFAITTGISCALFGVYYLVQQSGLVSFRP